MAKPDTHPSPTDRRRRARAHGLAVVACWCCMALAGCRNIDNAQVDVLESQLRQQEDYIYELEDYLVEYSEKLRQCRMVQCQGVVTTKSTKSRRDADQPELADDEPLPAPPRNGRKTPPTSRLAPPQAPPTEAVEPDAPVDPAPAPIEPEEMEAPALEIGPDTGSVPAKKVISVAAAPKLPPVAGDEAPLFIPDPIDYQADNEAPPADANPQSSSDPKEAGEPILASPAQERPRLAAERLEIRRVFTEPPTEDGAATGSLLVVVESLNATDEPVDADGGASLMIMARDESGDLKRIDRWDFTAEETKAAWQSSHLGDGLHLELPLANGELPPGELELWARVVQEDGTKLLTPGERPYKFEAMQLTSMDDAPETTLAAADPSIQKLSSVEDQPPAEDAGALQAKTAPAPQWRASDEPMEARRVEGFASTAGGKSIGWVSQPAGAQPPRVADASRGNVRPTWQKNATAPPRLSPSSSDSRAAWTPFR